MNIKSEAETRRYPCSTCSRVAGAIAELQADDFGLDRFPARGRKIDVATLDAFRNSDCSTCATAYSLFLRSYEEGKWRGITLEEDDYQRKVYVEPAFGEYQFAMDEVSTAMFHVWTLPTRAWNIHRNFSVKVDPHWIAVSSMSTWIQHCDDMHGGTCHHGPGNQGEVPNPGMILIDVRQDCLVQLHKQARYLALSYVWGGSPDLTTTNANFQELCHPGYFSNQNGAARLPETILDAMALTKALGLGYLWVDRLCIIQDDDISIAQNISSMASIYTDAYITIVASGGLDAHHGLPGAPGGSKPRQNLQTVLNFGADCELITKPHFAATSLRYDTRAWTFQEELLSPRKLFFQGEVAIWHCAEMDCEEDVGCHGWHNPNWFFKRRPSMISTSSIPDIRQFQYLLFAYSDRSLTFPEDKLRAFSGILEALRPKFHSGFHYGLPEDFLDSALLWTNFKPSQRIPHLPSWSWVGWTTRASIPGCLDIQSYMGTRERKIYQRRYPSMQMHRLVKLYKKPTGSGTLHAVSNAFYDWERSARDSDAALPLGWHRESRRVVGSIPAPGVEAVEDILIDMFWHDEQPSKLYRYPIPAVEVAQKSTVADDKWEPFLYFKAQRLICHFTSHRPYYRTRILDSSDKDANVIGNLDFNNSSTGDDYGLIELIALSRTTGSRREEGTAAGSKRKGKLRPRRISSDGDEDIYNVYNVFSITWEDGIAYRTGLGRVAKSAWDALGPDEIDIQLG